MKMKTKYRKTWAFLPLLIISFGVLVGLAVPAAAQGICVPETLDVTNVTGKVVSQLKQGEVPLSNASVMLLEDHYQGRMLTETITRENGLFSFSHIKPGKYVLKVSFPNLPTFYGVVRVKKVKASKVTIEQKELVVTIGTEVTKPCGGSKMEARAKKNS
jgi:hypothetical protein